MKKIGLLVLDIPDRLSGWNWCWRSRSELVGLLEE